MMIPKASAAAMKSRAPGRTGRCAESAIAWPAAVDTDVGEGGQYAPTDRPEPAAGRRPAPASTSRLNMAPVKLLRRNRAITDWPGGAARRLTRSTQTEPPYPNRNAPARSMFDSPGLTPGRGRIAASIRARPMRLPRRGRAMRWSSGGDQPW